MERDEADRPQPGSRERFPYHLYITLWGDLLRARDFGCQSSRVERGGSLCGGSAPHARKDMHLDRRSPEPNILPMSASGGAKKVTIHTDGACDGNPGPGGWAAVLRYGEHVREIAGGEPAATNNRMELQAAISALEALKAHCEVTLFTDSEYLRQGISEWLPRWRANNWRTIDRKPVKNEDLWRRLHAAASQHRVKWEWLKGHAGHADNERCDVLARAEVAKIRRSHSPEQLKTLRKAFVTTRDPNRNQGSLL